MKIDLTSLYLQHARVWTRESMEFEREPISDAIFEEDYRPISEDSNDALGAKLYRAHRQIAVSGISVTEEAILDLFSSLTAVQERPAFWRRSNVRIGGQIAPPFHEVPILMRQFCDNMAARLSDLSDARMIEALCYLEAEFLRVHPFADLNGRISRLLIVGIARQLQLPPIFPIYPELQRYDYFSDLSEYDRWRDPRVLMHHWQRRLGHGLMLVNCETLTDWWATE